jgi:cation diffusion facilitator CzcD-associated flavoprotein CzcO
MSQQFTFDVIVIGGGHAGRAAGLAIRRIALPRAPEAGAEGGVTWRALGEAEQPPHAAARRMPEAWNAQGRPMRECRTHEPAARA